MGIGARRVLVVVMTLAALLLATPAWSDPRYSLLLIIDHTPSRDGKMEQALLTVPEALRKKLVTLEIKPEQLPILQCDWKDAKAQGMGQSGKAVLVLCREDSAGGHPVMRKVGTFDGYTSWTTFYADVNPVLMDVASQLRTYPMLGVTYTPVSGLTPDFRATHSISATTGVYVNAVMPASSAALGGIQVGDILLQAEDKDLQTREDVQNFLRTRHYGESIHMSVDRRGQRIQLTVPLTRKAAP